MLSHICAFLFYSNAAIIGLVYVGILLIALNVKPDIIRTFRELGGFDVLGLFQREAKIFFSIGFYIPFQIFFGIWTEAWGWYGGVSNSWLIMFATVYIVLLMQLYYYYYFPVWFKRVE